MTSTVSTVITINASIVASRDAMSVPQLTVLMMLAGRRAMMPPKMMHRQTLADALLGDQFTQPDREHGAGGHGQHGHEGRQNILGPDTDPRPA